MSITLKEAEELLRRAGVTEYAHDARALFRRFGSFKPYEIITKDRECSSNELDDALRRRAEREPLAYILGEVDFYRESYSVTKDCLIPRQDTEILVDFAVKNIPDGENFIDICTGSGCVAISTLKNTSATRALAIDISDKALAIAKANAERNGVSSRLDLSLMDALRFKPKEQIFALLSNPPYVTNEEYKHLEEELFREPEIAFIGGDDGLDFYRAIVSNFKGKIKSNGFMAFEIGASQADALREIAEENLFSHEIIKDLSGLDRVAVLRPLK